MAPQLMRVLSAFAAVCLFSFGQTSDAEASVVYNWSGKCAIGCSGTSYSTLELRDRDFISFSYKSSSGTFDVPGDANLRRIYGSLPAEGTSSGANLFLSFSGLNFQINRENGLWGTIFSSNGIYEVGSGSTWSGGGGGSVSVPAPASLLALIGALLALAFVWRRREAVSAAPAASAA